MTSNAGSPSFEKDFSALLCRAAMNALHDGIILLNEDGRIIYWNNWIAEMSRRPREGAVGKSLAQIFPEQSGGRLLTAVQWALKNGLPSFLSSSLNRQQLPLTNNGLHIEQSIHVTPLAPTAERIFCLIRISDVTALVEKERLLRTRAQQLKESLAFVETTLLDSPVAIGVYRTSGPCVIANDAFASLFGISRECLQAENFLENVSWQKSGLLDIVLAALADGQQHRNEIQIDTEVKGQLCLSCLVRVTKLNEEDHLLLQILDQTEARKASEAIRQAKEAAESANRAKSSFLANMSHELRTPLNAILNFSDMLRRDVGLGEAQKATLATIHKSGDHLLGLVNNVLDIAKIEAGKLKAEKYPFNLSAVIDNARSFVAALAEVKGLALSVALSPDLPDWVEGDSLRLTQILSNLLSNAIKFTEHGEVRLQVTREGEDMRFLVVDSGIGMNEEQLARLFQPFEQADSSSTRNYGGTGLGLAISRNLANLMGGDIAVESQAGAGSSFTLQLSLSATAAPVNQPGALVAAGPRLVGLTALAAEDVEINRFILEDLLTYEGACVIFANNGQHALDLLQERGASAFDVVLMDVQMPVMDGLEAARHIALNTPGLPVIGLTAHVMIEERDKCLASGMVDHITKPVDINLLVAAIRRHVHMPTPSDTMTAPAVAPPLSSFVNCNDPDIIDLGVLAKRVGNDPAKIAEYATLFIKTTQDTLTEMSAALAAKDMVTLSTRSHRLKSAALTVGAMRLGELCREMERLEAGSDLKTAQAGFDRLQTLFVQITQCVTQAVGNRLNPTEKKPALKPAKKPRVTARISA